MGGGDLVLARMREASCSISGSVSEGDGSVWSKRSGGADYSNG